MADPMIAVQLPDGRTLHVQTSDPAQAAAAARKYMAYEALNGMRGPQDVSGQAARSMSFGLSDLTNAGLGAVLSQAPRLVGKDPGFGLGDAFDAGRMVEKDRSSQYATKHPIQSGVAGVLGALAGPGQAQAGKFIIGAGAKGLPAVAGMLTRSAAVAGAQGAVQGAATADPGQTVQGAISGGLQGAAAGVALPAGLGVAGKIASRTAVPIATAAMRAANRVLTPAGAGFLDPAATAVARLRQALTADGLDTNGVNAAIAEWNRVGGPSPALMDVAGENTRALIRGAAAQGAGRQAAAKYADTVEGNIQDSAMNRTAALTAGDTRSATAVSAQATAQRDALAQQSPDRLLQDVADTLGVDPAAARGDIESIVANGQAKAGPLYETALANPAPVLDGALHPQHPSSLVNRPVIKSAIGSVASDVLNAGGDPAALGIVRRVEQVPGGGTRDVYDSVSAPSAKTWDLVKKAISRQVERNAVTGAALPDSQSAGNFGVGVASRDLTGALRNAIPGYGEALDTSGDYLSTRGAYDRASGLLFHPRVQPADVSHMFAGMSTGEAEGAKAAMANDILQAAENGRLPPGKFQNPSVRAKLAVVFGPKANDFLARVGQESTLAGGGQVAGATGDRAAYSAANSTLADLSRGGRVMSTPPDQFALGAAGPDLQVGVRQALTDAIGRPAEGSTGILNRIATSTNQGQNLAASFGQTTANDFRTAIQQIIDQTKNARFINPNTGSQTAGRALDASLVDSVPTSGLGAVAALIDKLRRGATLTDAEREAIVKLGTGSAPLPEESPSTLALRAIMAKVPALSGLLAAPALLQAQQGQ